MKTHPVRNFLLAATGAIASVFAIVFPLGAQTLGEAIDATNLTWTTGGDAVWRAETTNTYDGVDAVQSGVVQSNQTSWLETTVVGPATVSFWSLTQTTSGNSFGWRFTINDIGQPYPPIAIQLPPLWNQQVYDLGNGTNILRWTISGGRFYGGGSGFVCLDEFTVSSPRPLAIVYQPTDWTVYSGAFAFFSVLAIGTPPLHYQWLKDETNISDATDSWLGFNKATTNDTGVYSVIVSNSQGSVVSSNALLTVLPPSPPFFTFEPESTTVYTGQSFNWWFSVDGSPPFAAVWQKDGTNFLEETSSGPLGNSYLTFGNVSMADAGNYTFLVTNDYGSAASSNLVLTVVASVAPVITRQPRSLDVAEGVNTWMSLDATGVPGPWYIWTREGSPPDPFDPLFPPWIFNTSPGRSFNDVAPSNAGVYSAIVTNYAGGVASQDALLTVLPAITNIGSWDQDAVDIFVTNGLAYLARGTDGLAILNINDPASPQLIGCLATSGYFSAVQVSGGLAFVADSATGLRILSVTNSANPVLVGRYNVSGLADIAVRSNFVFATDGAAGLLILSVSNSAAPILIGSYMTNISADNICLDGDYAVVSSLIPEIILGTNMPAHMPGLFVLDISNPAHPSEVGQLSLGIGRVTSRNQYVFGLSQNSLQVITITNPAQPAVVGTFNYYYSTNNLPSLGIAASDVRVVNDLAYLIGNSGGQSQLYILDVRDPAKPIPVGYYTDAGQPTTLAVDGNQVYFSGPESPLEIVRTPFDTSPVAAPALAVSAQNGVQLQIQGRRGLHYNIEYTGHLTRADWQILQTVLLTNNNIIIQVPSGPARRFFRLKQLD